MVRNAAPDTAPPAPLTTRLVIWEINHPDNDEPALDDGSCHVLGQREASLLTRRRVLAAVRRASHPRTRHHLSHETGLSGHLLCAICSVCGCVTLRDQGSMVRPFAVQTNLIGPAKNPMRNTPAMTMWKELRSGLPTISILECTSTVYSDLSPNHSISKLSRTSRRETTGSCRAARN